MHIFYFLTILNSNQSSTTQSMHWNHKSPMRDGFKVKPIAGLASVSHQFKTNDRNFNVLSKHHQ